MSANKFLEWSNELSVGILEIDAQHQILVDLHAKLEKGKGAIGFELAFFLKGWITQHILEGDKRYADHFLSFGIKSDVQVKSSWSQRVWNLLGKR